MSRCPKFTALHDAHDLAEGIAQITPGARDDRMAARTVIHSLAVLTTEAKARADSTSHHVETLRAVLGDLRSAPAVRADHTIAGLHARLTANVASGLFDAPRA